MSNFDQVIQQAKDKSPEERSKLVFEAIGDQLEAVTPATLEQFKTSFRSQRDQLTRAVTGS